LGRHIAHRDVATLGDELAYELATHARPATRNDGEPACEILHVPLRRFRAAYSPALRFAKLGKLAPRCFTHHHGPATKIVPSCVDRLLDGTD
jgi:hypothetical protein